MMAQQQQQQQQQQYFQYVAQPGGSYPGTTVYTYPGAPQPQMMVIQPAAASTTVLKNKFDSSGSRAAVVLATIQFIIGICLIIFQSTASHLESSLGRVYTTEYAGTGIWCGILILVTGAVGLSAAKRNSKVLITTFLVMNVLSSVAVWIVLAFAVVSMGSLQRCQRTGIYNSFISLIPLTCKDTRYTVWMAMDALMIALAVVEFIIAVISALYSCRALCNCCPATIVQQPRSGVHVATNVQLPSQQQQHQAVGSKPYPMQESYMQYPAAGAAPMVSYGQPSYAPSGQPLYYPQQQQVAAYPQPAYGPYAATSESAIREAAPPGAGYPGTQAYYPPAAGHETAMPSAPEPPPNYAAAMKL